MNKKRIAGLVFAGILLTVAGISQTAFSAAPAATITKVTVGAGAATAVGTVNTDALAYLKAHPEASAYVEFLREGVLSDNKYDALFTPLADGSFTASRSALPKGDYKAWVAIGEFARDSYGYYGDGVHENDVILSGATPFVISVERPDPGMTVNSVEITSSSEGAVVTVTGTISNAQKALFTSVFSASVDFVYGVYSGDGTTLSGDPIKQQCTTRTDNTFKCIVQGLEAGQYYYRVVFNNSAIELTAKDLLKDNGTKWYGMFSGTKVFIVLPTDTLEAPGYQLSDARVVNNANSAEVTVAIASVGAKPDTRYLIELATAIAPTTGSTYTCMSTTPRTLSTPVTTSSFRAVFSVTTPGTYCVQLRQLRSSTDTLGVPVAVGSGASSYFTNSVGDAVNGIISVLGVKIDPGATLDGTANPSGCVTNSDNSNYCMLAPLPGLGDGSGNLDVTKGFGDYLLTIIQIVMGVIGVLCVLMIIIGGIEYMSTVSVGEKEGAKNRITSALLGLLLALSSYVILRTLNPKLVELGVTIPNAQLQLEGDEGPEESTITPTNLPSVDSVVIPSGTATELAKKILANPNVRFTVLKDEPRATPRQNIQDVADGKLAWTSARGDKGAKQTTLSEQMLGAILAAASKTSFTITEIAGGRHSKNSAHYAGRAMDIAATPGDLGRNVSIMNACLAAGAKKNQIFGPCNNVYKPDGEFTQCTATKYLTNKDHQTHIHCGW